MMLSKLYLAVMLRARNRGCQVAAGDAAGQAQVCEATDSSDGLAGEGVLKGGTCRPLGDLASAAAVVTG